MSDNKRKKKIILSLDGGGIRGIIPAMVMIEIEAKLQELTGNENAKIRDYFDIIAGTSTGGILGAFYLHPDYMSRSEAEKVMAVDKSADPISAKKALNLYKKEGINIFNNSKRKFYNITQFFNASKYSPLHIEKQFETVFGNRKIQELKGYCLITSFNMTENCSTFFSSKDKSEYLIKDVVRATSAAPTYFPPAYISDNGDDATSMYYVDGGVFANNPVLCAYAEAVNKFEDVDSSSDLLILSIGTGAKKIAEEKKNPPTKWGLLNWATSIPSIMMGGGEDAVHFQMKQIFSKGSLRENYVRIDVEESDKRYDVNMDNASKENIDKLLNAGKNTIRTWFLEKSTDEAKKLQKFLEKVVYIKDGIAPSDPNSPTPAAPVVEQDQVKTQA